MKNRTMYRIKNVSRILKWLFILSMLIVPMMYLCFWVFDFHLFDDLSVVPAFPTQSLHQTMTMPIRVVGAIVSCIPLAFFMVKTLFLVKLFNLYQKGIIFSFENVRNIRRVGWTMLLWEIVKPFYQVLLTFVISSNNPPGHRFVAISLNNVDISTTIIAVIIIVVSWIMREGVRLEQQQRLTV